MKARRSPARPRSIAAPMLAAELLAALTLVRRAPAREVTDPYSEAPVAPPAAPSVAGEAAAPVRPLASPNFTGVLLERGTRAPLSGLLVSAFRAGTPPLASEAMSEGAGLFSFFELAPGRWQVRIEAPGYQLFETTESIVAGQATHATYYLEKSSDNPFDVTVTAQRPKKEVSRTSLPIQQIEQTPGVVGDPMAVVQSLAGVARSAFASGQIIVRGSAPEDTRVFVDGIELPLIYHFGGIRSVIPMPLLEAIDFYPGNFAPVYGRVTGGVVDVRLKRVQPERIGGSLDVNLLDASLYFEAPLGSRGGVAIAGRRSYIGDVLSAVLPDDTLSLTVAPRYYDYQLLANYRPHPEHDVRLFFLSSDDRLEFLFANPADLDPNLGGDRLQSAERFYRTFVSHRFVPDARFENVLSLAYGYSDEDDAIGQLAVDVQTHTLQLRDAVHHELAAGVALGYGVDALLTAFDVFVRAPELPKEGEPQDFDLSDIRTTRDSGTRLSPAAYAQAELEPLAGLFIYPGVRLEHHGGIAQTLVEPRLTTRLQLGEQVVAKAGVGWFSREPSEDELNPDFGNVDLKAERALHYSLGAEYQPLPQLSFDATLFYKSLSDLVSRSDALVDEAGTLRPLRFDNAGTGKAYGAELLIRHELAYGFSGWLAYTLSRSLRQDSAASSERLFDFDQTHILTLLGSYALPHHWQIGARFRWVSGNPRTPITGAVFNADADRYEPRYGAPNSERNAPFHQLDVRIDKRWTFDTWLLNAYLEVQNAYNRANPEGLSYNYDYRQNERQSGLPILPVFGLRADF
jgi:outer membrane receptor protein involved in Fe transport